MCWGWTVGREQWMRKHDEILTSGGDDGDEDLRPDCDDDEDVFGGYFCFGGGTVRGLIRFRKSGDGWGSVYLFRQG